MIDADDREIIAWKAVTGAGISGSDIRDLVLEAVEARFGDSRAPNTIEFLADNGSPYTAGETRIFATQLGLTPCFTPVASPKSNGVAEAFVKTFKRDDARIKPLPSAEHALAQIAGWIDDYNEIYPHSWLRMRSPRKFRRAQPWAEVSAQTGATPPPPEGSKDLRPTPVGARRFPPERGRCRGGAERVRRLMCQRMGWARGWGLGAGRRAIQHGFSAICDRRLFSGGVGSAKPRRAPAAPTRLTVLRGPA